MSRPSSLTPASPAPVRPEGRRGELRAASRGFRAFLDAQSDKAVKRRDAGPETAGTGQPRELRRDTHKPDKLVAREGHETRDAFEPRARGQLRESRLRDDETRWSPPPPALLPPIERSTPTAPIVGSARAVAEATALAERVLSSVRVGRVMGMPEVRLRLGVGSREGVEVRLRLDEGRVIPVLVTDRPAEVAELGERLDALFAERGIDAERVVIERG